MDNLHGTTWKKKNMNLYLKTMLIFFVMLCQCSVTVIMFLQQCVAINVFVTMFLYIICNNVLVTGYVLLAFGEIA